MENKTTEISQVEVISLLKTLELSHEEINSKVGYLIQDDVGQLLAVVRLQLGTLLRSIPEGKEKQLIGELAEIVGEVNEKLRVMSSFLLPSALKYSKLEIELKSYCRQVAHKYPLTLKLEADNLETLEELSTENKFCIYRLFEDMLHHMAENLGYRELTISLRISGEAFYIIAKGVGEKSEEEIDPKLIQRIKARSIILSGFVETETDWKTNISLRIPISAS